MVFLIRVDRQTQSLQCSPRSSIVPNRTPPPLPLPPRLNPPDRPSSPAPLPRARPRSSSPEGSSAIRVRLQSPVPVRPSSNIRDTVPTVPDLSSEDEFPPLPVFTSSGRRSKPRNRLNYLASPYRQNDREATAEKLKDFNVILI